MISRLCDSWRKLVRTFAVTSLATLSACVSPPPDRFYTLGTEAEPTITGDTVGPSFRIDVRPVNVPPAVARSQLVVQVDAAQVQILEHDRWASSLPDEIRHALIVDVNRQAGAPDKKMVAHGADVPVYQVAVDVGRFESWPGSHVLIDAVWSVSMSSNEETLTCHSVVSEPVSVGYRAMIGGHRRAISVVATQIATVVRAFAAGSTGSPSRSSDAIGRAANWKWSCPHAAGGGQTKVSTVIERLEE